LALTELEQEGFIVRDGKGNQVVYTIAPTDQSTDDIVVGMKPAKSILKAFRKKGEAFMPKPEPRPSAGPLANVVRKIKGGKSSPKKTPVTASIDFETLEQCDALYSVCKAMAKTRPLDAAAMAQPLLKTLLRLAWAKASGKPDTNPLAESIAMKLYNRGHVSKNSMRKINAAIADGAKLEDVLMCSRALLVWLAADEPQRID